MFNKLFMYEDNREIPEEYMGEFDKKIDNINTLRTNMFLKIFIIIQICMLIINNTVFESQIKEIYIGMSTVGIVSGIIFFIILYRFNDIQMNYFQIILVIFFLLWSALYALFDHVSHGLITIYNMMLFVFPIIYFKYRNYMIISGIIHIFFILSYIVMNSNFEKVSIILSNSTMFLFISWLIARGLYIDFIKRFLNEKEIINKNEQLIRFSKIKDALIEISNSIIKLDNIYDLYDIVLEKALDSITEAYIGSVLILNEDSYFTIVASRGFSEDMVNTFRMPIEDSFIWIKSNGNIEKTVIMNDLDPIKDKTRISFLDSKEGIDIKSSISSPIMVDGKLYGLINIDSKRKNVFDSMDVDIIDYISHQLSNAIKSRGIYEKTVYYSRFDELTAIYNRRYFEERLNNLMEENTEGDLEFILVIFDLDNLKTINDNYGHLVGDQYILKGISMIKSFIDDGDILGRFGGDEFVGIFFNKNYNEFIERINYHLNDNKNILFKDDDKEVRCSISYGVAQYPKDGNNLIEIVKVADKRMYRHKKRRGD
ncbi:sensor domain-containing diguanylate cyclase [Clostridiisalibacter paucivorans]|uniref:sensor domain-containing diguanylate cyclase n=1 Tax=Clostridiisalibacter paucivorans TaxID=408753 RepID=UPI00047A5820|nr:sensor domain-containing diguanylate cyclase [Clostridiisalibacter paucivorans]